MITFNEVLRSVGLDPAGVILARHQDARARRSLYALWTSPADRDPAEQYQAVQKRHRFGACQFVASFVVAPGGETLFVGLYEVRGTIGRCPPGTIDPVTGLDVTGEFHYDMARDTRLAGYEGRLTIDWGPGTRSWVQRASRRPKPVLTLGVTPEPPFPGLDLLCVDVGDVPGMPLSWQKILREVKGVYLLADKDSGELYVGSAKGDESMWGRWSDYARTGHGGNKELKLRNGARYQLSVLQVVPASQEYRIEEIESLWKRKLLSRERGLNRN